MPKSNKENIKKTTCFLILILTSLKLHSLSVPPPLMLDSVSIFEPLVNSNEYRPTITTQLGHILKMAELKYGERDKNYTILGVETTIQDYPHIFFPNHRKQIVIRITKNCLYDIDRAVFQVAHELIHCLAPTGESNTNVFEEGLANLFAIEYCRENSYGINWSSNLESYTEATKLLLKILAVDNNIIKKLRVFQPTISKIDNQLIRKLTLSYPIALL